MQRILWEHNRSLTSLTTTKFGHDKSHCQKVEADRKVCQSISMFSTHFPRPPISQTLLVYQRMISCVHACLQRLMDWLPWMHHEVLLYLGGAFLTDPWPYFSILPITKRANSHIQLVPSSVVVLEISLGPWMSFKGLGLFKHSVGGFWSKAQSSCCHFTLCLWHPPPYF